MLLLCTPLLPYSMLYADDTGAKTYDQDAAVLSACIDVIAPVFSDTGDAQGLNHPVSVTALDKPHWQYIEEQAAAEFGVSKTPSDELFPFPPRAYSSRIQVSAQNSKVDKNNLDALFTVLRQRTRAGWRLPAGITSLYQTIVYQAPENSDAAPKHGVSFSFWPPGYSDSSPTALVRAFIEPSGQGATATCLLRRQDMRWHVVNYWLFFYN